HSKAEPKKKSTVFLFGGEDECRRRARAMREGSLRAQLIVELFTFGNRRIARGMPCQAMPITGFHAWTRKATGVERCCSGAVLWVCRIEQAFGRKAGASTVGGNGRGARRGRIGPCASERVWYAYVCLRQCAA